MRFTVNGTTYDYDGGRLSVAEAILVLEKTGLGVKAFMSGLSDMNPLALKAVVLLAMQRAGEKVSWDGLDFDLLEVAASFLPDVDLPEPGDARWQAPDPTGDGSTDGTKPTPAETPTWPPSPTTSTSQPL